MRTSWRGVGAFFLLFVPLAGCSDDDVVFPPNDAAVDAADAPVNRPDADGSAPDTTDVSMDTCCVDAGRDNDDTGAPETPSDTIDVSTDPTPDTDEDVGNDADDEGDAATDLPDATPDIVDATSEEAGTCESRCASGVCDTNGNCSPCVKDDECTGGRVCNAGTCGPRCGDGGVACTGNLVCCSEHCVDTTRDPRYCGACGTTCSAAQFCGNASTPVCRDSVMRNVCNTKRATFLRDGQTDDDASSQALQNAIDTLCVPKPVLTQIGQGLSTAINTTTGQPLVGGGELLVAAGGDSWQLLVRYLETSGTSTVYNVADGAKLEWKRRGGAPDGGDALIKLVDLTTVTATNDFFLVEVVKDPISGTFSLVVYGVDSPGTIAGAFYFANVMLPSIVGDGSTTFTDAWYIYQWTASDAGPRPSLSDTYTLIASGL